MIKSKLMMIICAFMTFINAYAMRPNERNGGNSNKQYNIPLINSNLTTVKNEQYIDHGKPQVIESQGMYYSQDMYSALITAEAKSEQFVQLLNSTILGPAPNKMQGMDAIRYLSEYTEHLFQKVFKDASADIVKLYCLCALLRGNRGKSADTIKNFVSGVNYIKKNIKLNNLLKAELTAMYDFAKDHSESCLLVTHLEVFLWEVCE